MDRKVMLLVLVLVLSAAVNGYVFVESVFNWNNGYNNFGLSSPVESEAYAFISGMDSLLVILISVYIIYLLIKEESEAARWAYLLSAYFFIAALLYVFKVGEISDLVTWMIINFVRAFAIFGITMAVKKADILV